MLVPRPSPLAPLCTLKVGGPARHLLVAESESDVVDAVHWAKSEGLPLRILGGGSNVVIHDGGLDGVVVKMALRGVDRRVDEGSVRITAAAGEIWNDLVALTVDEGWQGLECLGGIPGLVGATPIQNVGAYGQEVSESIDSVRVLDRETSQIRVFDAPSCGFAYRDSFFKSGQPDRFVVLSVTFRLEPDGAPKIAYGELERRLELAGGGRRPSLSEVHRTVIELRRKKSMVLDPDDENHRSCGSFFVNALVERKTVESITRAAGDAPPHFEQPDGRFKVPAAWLIQRAGLEPGFRRGAAGLSSKHTLAIVAHDGATARDVIGFAHHVRQAVLEKFAVKLVPEPDFWGFSKFDERLPVVD